jgi:hypothetical protein
MHAILAVPRGPNKVESTKTSKQHHVHIFAFLVRGDCKPSRFTGAQEEVCFGNIKFAVLSAPNYIRFRGIECSVAQFARPLGFHLHHDRIQIALVQNILGRLELGLGAPNSTASKGSDGKPLRTHVQDLLANRLFLSHGHLIFCYSAVLAALTRLEIEDCSLNLREDADLWDRGQAPRHLAGLSKLRKLHLGVEVPCQNRTELLLACSSLTALEVCALASMQCISTSLLSVIGEK